MAKINRNQLFATILAPVAFAASTSAHAQTATQAQSADPSAAAASNSSTGPITLGNSGAVSGTVNGTNTNAGSFANEVKPVQTTDTAVAVKTGDVTVTPEQSQAQSQKNSQKQTNSQQTSQAATTGNQNVDASTHNPSLVPLAAGEVLAAGIHAISAHTSSAAGPVDCSDDTVSSINHWNPVLGHNNRDHNDFQMLTVDDHKKMQDLEVKARLRHFDLEPYAVKDKKGRIQRYLLPAQLSGRCEVKKITVTMEGPQSPKSQPAQPAPEAQVLTPPVVEDKKVVKAVRALPPRRPVAHKKAAPIVCKPQK